MLEKADDDGEWVMSLDGASQNNTQLKAAAQHLAKIDAFVRRSPSGDSPSRAARYRVLLSAESPSGTQRHYPRYVPAANIAQALLDLILIGGSQVVVLSLIYSRLALVGM